MRKLLLIASMLCGMASFAQNDTVVPGMQQDSLLDLQTQAGSDLLLKADSIRVADSLVQVQLLAEIANLQTADAERKAQLQARLDSLKGAQDVKNARLKAEIDSMRSTVKGAPVVLWGDTILYIYSKLGPFSPSERAKSIADKVDRLFNANAYDSTTVYVFENEESSDLMHGELILLTVNNRDAFWMDMPRAQLAETYVAKLKKAINKHIAETSTSTKLKRFGLLALVILIFVLITYYLNKGFTWLNKRLVSKGSKYIKGIKIKNYELLTVEREILLVRMVLRILKWIVIAVIVYLMLPFAFSIFPSTESYATTLFGYILNPLKGMGMSFVNYIPSLITIIIIVVITRYIVRFVKFLSKEIQTEQLKIPGFYTDWAKPTASLINILIIAFSFIVIFPYLPGSNSPVFQGVSVFLGILISLGSSSAIGNIVAGLVITYMRGFKIGDRVRIGETTGDVIKKSMLVTHIRTIKNEDVTIPNSLVMGAITVNYTSSAKDLGLILNTTVTIGYDVPWRKVHQLLIDAALKCDDIKKNPQPFVLQTSLDDFYVSYQINGYTEVAKKSAITYSQLYAHIQDGFAAAGVEIMSPHYRAERDGSDVTIPKEEG